MQTLSKNSMSENISLAYWNSLPWVTLLLFTLNLTLRSFCLEELCKKFLTSCPWWIVVLQICNISPRGVFKMNIRDKAVKRNAFRCQATRHQLMIKLRAQKIVVSEILLIVTSYSITLYLLGVQVSNTPCHDQTCKLYLASFVC